MLRTVELIVDQTRLDRDIAGRMPYAALFSPGPLGGACAAWSIPASPPPAAAIAGEVPMLILRGWIDPFSAPPSEVTEAFDGATNVYDLDIPNQSYNALALGCPRTIRDAWLDSPTAPPSDVSCLAQIPQFQLGQ